MIEAHRDRDERRIARRRLERDLAADPPARAERAARHPLPRDMAVGIGEGDREPIEPALMDHERDIAAIDGQRTQIGAQPETAVLVARGRATTRARRSEEHTSEIQSLM